MKMNRRDFVRTTVGASLAAAAPRTLLAQAPNIVTSQSIKPVVISPPTATNSKTAAT